MKKHQETEEISRYYDWHKTLSYNALLTMVITARDRGKTYGIRKQCIKDFLKDKSSFAEICRYKDEIKHIKNGYFDKIVANNEFPGWMFKVEGNKGYIAPECEQYDEKGRKIKPDWQFLCGFYSLSEYQNIKKRTHIRLKRVIMDETIIEKLDRYHTYFNNEYDILLNIVDSLAREDSSTEQIDVRIYLLSNACDLVNPYFIKFGINDMPKFGYHWYKNKTILLHYEDPKGYSQKKKQNTLVGRLSSDDVSNTANDNIFIQRGTEFIQKKSKIAKFKFGIKCKDTKFGVWIDYSQGYVYIDPKIPNNANPVYSLYREDNTLNTISADRANIALTSIKKLYYQGIIRYSDYSTMELFANILEMLGIR